MTLIRTLLAFAFVILAAVALLAQDASTTNDDGSTNEGAWLQFAEMAEGIIESTDTETARLESLREQLVNWRGVFLLAESANDPRVETIQAQIDALGPPPTPDTGVAEPPDIVEQRADLQEALDRARAPGRQATAAYTRADGLISEIDEIIRTRQRDALLEARPTPLNPANWDDGLTAAVSVSNGIVAEIRRSLATEWRRRAVTQGAPVTLTLVVIGLLLLARGRVWMSRATAWVQSRQRQRGRITLGFLVSIGQVVLPMTGMAMLGGAILSTEILGAFGRALLTGIVAIIFGGYSAVWIVGRVFPRGDNLPAAFDVSEDIQRHARSSALSVGILAGLATLLSHLSLEAVLDPVGEAVLALPIYAGLAISFYWLARVFRSASLAYDPEAGPSFGQRLLAFMSRAVTAVAIVGPLVAILGYHALADAIMVPSAVTLGVVGVSIALQAPMRDAYAWATQTSIQAAREALIPVLMNFLLAIAAIPLLALAWGMRPAELGEIYNRFEEGISFGDTRVTPGDILAVIIVFAVVYAATRLFQGALKSTVLPRTKLDAGARNAVVSFAGYAGIGLAVLLAINAGGIDLTALAVVFGALSVGIGFGLQNVVQNFVAGIILLIERPIGEGDWIEVGTQMGIVKDISVRSTTIETFDKQQVIVPNADFISGTVTNWTRGNQLGRSVLTVGVAYGTDTRRVQEILTEIIKENPHVARFPEPGVDFMGFGADSLDFRIRAILSDVNQLLTVRTEVNHRIAERFAEEGIEIPFAQRDIWLRNPEALVSMGSPPDKKGPDET